MRRLSKTFPMVVSLLVALAPVSLAADAPKTAPAEWAMNATIIEACSCPMFCQCYFSDRGAAHHNHETGNAEHFCRFNNAFKVNKGHYGSTNLDGLKFWLAGDQGSEFGDGEIDWAVATFEPAATPEQREAVSTILGALYPIKVTSFEVAPDAPIEWSATADRAVARIDGGKRAEVVLKKTKGMTADPVVIQNLPYWSAARHNGFVLMPNEVVAYRVGPKAFEYRGTNGFMITFDISSKDAAKAKVAEAQSHAH